MKFKPLFLCLLVITGPAHAQSNSTPIDAFNAGKAFGQSGSNTAAGTVNSTTGTKTLPNYTTTAPESAHFGNGTGNVGAAGTAKMAECSTGGSSGSAFAQQECDAINFLSKNPTTRPKFIIDKKNDPLMTGSKDTIANPAGDKGKEVQQCRVIHVDIPAKYETEVCEQSMGMENITCNKTLIPQCAYLGAEITNPVTSKGGAFKTVAMTPTSTRGVDLYKLEVPYRACGSEGNAAVGFKLDTVGQGGYITINLSNLDDAAAVAVNNYTVFAGYPNNGPMYSGSFFPLTKAAFQLGYTWTEQYGERCAVFDSLGKCKSATPLYQNFSANAKLLDFCPGGYDITPQSRFSICSKGSCSAPPGNTASSIRGFFCNAEGKFMMNRHEGKGSWNGEVNAQMPLKEGVNTIQVYWGTGTNSDECGNVTISGQIFNVAPTCDTPWQDGCAGLRPVKE